MAIVHDLAEALAGDITPHDGVSSSDKFQLEQKSLETMCQALGESTNAGISTLIRVEQRTVE